MPTISEIDHDLRNHKYSTMRKLFIEGRIGEHTFRASLLILGIRGKDLDTEVNLANMERKPGRGKGYGR
jgi:hypothetical protein